jgi:hypothetical protein
MIKANSITELEEVLEKAKKKSLEINPELHIIEFGIYQVQSSDKSKFYEVRAGKTNEGEFFIACLCRGSLEGKACYHAAKVLLVHKAMAKVEQDKKRAEIEHKEQDNALYVKPQPKEESEKINGIRV